VRVPAGLSPVGSHPWACVDAFRRVHPGAVRAQRPGRRRTRANSVLAALPIDRQSLLRRQRCKHIPQTAVVRLELIPRVSFAIDDAEIVHELRIRARREALIHLRIGAKFQACTEGSRGAILGRTHAGLTTVFVGFARSNAACPFTQVGDSAPCVSCVCFWQGQVNARTEARTARPWHFTPYLAIREVPPGQSYFSC